MPPKKRVGFRNPNPSPVYDPAMNLSPVCRLPRPLWQLKEELEAELANRPGLEDFQARADWAARVEGLKMWIAYAESPLSKWQKV